MPCMDTGGSASFLLCLAGLQIIEGQKDNSWNVYMVSSHVQSSLSHIIIKDHVYNWPNTLFLGAVYIIIITPIIGFRLTCKQRMHIIHSLGSIPASGHFYKRTLAMLLTTSKI